MARAFAFVCNGASGPEGKAMAEVQLRHVSKRWGAFVGVHRFDLTIADREFLVLLGPSG